MNALTDVHVGTDMRPEDSKGVSLARNILCLNVSVGTSWWYSRSSARERIYLDDTALDVNAVAEPQDGSQPFIERGF